MMRVRMGFYFFCIFALMNIGFDAKRIFHNTTGLGNYSRDLVRILSKYFPENQYLLYNPKKGKVKRLVPNNLNVFEKLPQNFIGKLIPSVWRSKCIIKQLLQDKVDIFHGLTGELPYGINSTQVKTVVTIHDLIFVRYPQQYKAFDRKIYLKKFQYAAQFADVVVAISEQTKRDIVDFLHINPEKIKVIYQGCHPVFKQKLSDDFIQSVVKKYALPQKYLLYIGSVIERKNLLSAVKAVQQTGDHLVVVGDGDHYMQKVKNYLTQHQLQHQVTFLKGLTMEEIAVLYKKAEIFIYPSIFEGFGIPIIEALYSGVPVVTGQGSCFPEAGGLYSKYVDPYNINQITEAIHTIKNNENIRNEMIEKGLQYVHQFDDDNIAEQWNNLYQTLYKN